MLLRANGQTSFPSEMLDERQREITDYAIVSYLRSDGSVDSQVSFFGRYSSLNFTPGANVGDILYDGLSPGRLQARRSLWRAGGRRLASGQRPHLRFGLLFQADDLLSTTTSLVLPTAAGGPGNPNPNPLCTDPSQTCQTSDVPLTVLDNGARHAWALGVYVQDEWKLFSTLTLNYGVRYDQYSAFNAENQTQPARQSGVDAGRRHRHPSRLCALFLAAALRECRRPPTSPCSTTPPRRRDHTDTTPKAERADYYDAGLTHKLTDQISLGLDSYFKADSNLLDEGQFGAPIILTPFNYQSGRQYGGEFTANYNTDNFNAYLNASYERAAGRNITSSEFEFGPDDLAYISTHYIPLDHQQIISLSGGASYKWQGTIFSTDFIYGSGLRRDGATPNGDHVPAYITVNLGVSHKFDFCGRPDRARSTSSMSSTKSIEIRDGTGVGVGAPQFGARRGFFAGLSKAL